MKKKIIFNFAIGSVSCIFFLNFFRDLLFQSSAAARPFQIVQPASSNSPSLVFIKTHKTGSTTLSSIIHRYGYNHLKSFAFSKKSSNGHFRHSINDETPRRYFYPPINCSKEGYDITAMHFIFDNTSRATLNKIMKGGNKTIYITILRDPVYQYESFFSFFLNQFKYPTAIINAKLKGVPVLKEFIDYPKKYLKADMDEARNRQLFDLTGRNCISDEDQKSRNECSRSEIKEQMEQLDKKINLVLILEHFDESLLLFGKIMNWKMEDLLYVRKNIRMTRNEMSEELAGKIRHWNSVDQMLYDHYNVTLWKKIEKYGPEFSRDLEIFQERLSYTFHKCKTKTRVSMFNKLQNKALSNAVMEYSSGPNTNDLFCLDLVRDHYKQLNLIKGRQINSLCSSNSVFLLFFNVFDRITEAFGF